MALFMSLERLFTRVLAYDGRCLCGECKARSLFLGMCKCLLYLRWGLIRKRCLGGLKGTCGQVGGIARAHTQEEARMLIPNGM